jgi:CO/xanthine dehydrogenase FAD-binding subunit
MKPALFRYYDPDTLDEALALLSEWGDDAKILAGGQTLGPMLGLRVVRPRAVVDINRITGLDYRRETQAGLTIGALTRQQALEDDPALADRQPLVAEAIPYIAHRAIRNRGTVGGSLAHADPSAEWGGLVTALDAHLVVRRRAGERTIPAAELFTGLLDTAFQPDEILTEIRLPAWPSGAGWSFQELSRRHGDYAICGIACVLVLEADRTCCDVRIAAFGVEASPRRLPRAEEMLAGERPELPRILEAGRRAAAEVDPLDDRQASAAYRRHLLEILVERAVKSAVTRTAGGKAID